MERRSTPNSRKIYGPFRPLTAGELESCEFRLCNPAQRPGLWQQLLSLNVRRDDEANEALLLAGVLSRAKDCRNQCVEFSEKITAGAIAALIAETEVHVENVLSGNRVPAFVGKLDRALEYVLLGSTPSNAPADARAVFRRIKWFFFGTQVGSSRALSSPFFSAGVRTFTKPVNYSEALAFYYHYRYLKLEQPARRRVSFVLTSGFHPFTAGDLPRLQALATEHTNRERVMFMHAFADVQVDCARNGCFVSVIVPDVAQANQGLNIAEHNPAIESALALQSTVRMAKPPVSDDHFRFRLLDPRRSVTLQGRTRYAAEYLQFAYRYVRFLAEELEDDSTTGQWTTIRQDLLILRPLAEYPDILGSFDSTSKEVESFNEWLRCFIDDARPLTAAAAPPSLAPAKAPRGSGRVRRHPKQ